MLIEHAYGFEPLTDRPQRLYDIWNRWRGEHAMPAREAVMPENRRDLLPYVALMGASSDPAECRYIITGTAVDVITVQSFKGRTIRETMAKGNPTRSAEILTLYGDVIANRRPSFSLGSMAYQDRGYILYDRVLLPLSANGVKVDHILCGFFYDSI